MAIRDLVKRRDREHERGEARRDEGGLMSLQREMNRLFDDFFQDLDLPVPSLFGRRDLGWGGTGGALFTPSVDVSETDRDVVVSVELPGLDQKDVAVELDEHSLTLSGEKKEEREEKQGAWLRREARYGSFHRVVPLPAGIDRDKAKAKFRKGVLTVTLPKRPEARQASHRVTIESD